MYRSSIRVRSKYGTCGELPDEVNQTRIFTATSPVIGFRSLLNQSS